LFSIFSALILAGTGVGSFIFGYIGTSIWVLVGERVLRRIRTLYFNNLMQQEMGFFDANQSGMLVSRLAGDALLVQSGISEKTSLFFYYGGQVIGSLVVSFIAGWKMTLVMLALSPLLAIGAALEARVLTAGARRGQKTYSGAHDVPSEAVSSIRTVLSFTAEDRVKARYADLLAGVYKIGRRKAHVTGVALGFSVRSYLSSTLVSVH
jgi:ABC-type multidrug transport system fused ATPase/permease subunit